MKYLTDEVLNKVLKYVKDYQLTNGTAPTIRNIGENCNIGSKNSVCRILDKLHENGQLDFDEYTSKKYISVPSNLSVSNSKIANVVGTVACGSPILAVENIETTVALPNNIFGNFDKYILKAKGNSMIDLGINDGDYMVVEKTNSANVGQVVIARLNEDEVTAKLLAKDSKGKFYLQPANNSVDEIGNRIYKDIYPEGEWNVEGIVRQIIHEI